jgi:hypothetical protein
MACSEKESFGALCRVLRRHNVLTWDEMRRELGAVMYKDHEFHDEDLKHIVADKYDVSDGELERV